MTIRLSPTQQTTYEHLLHAQTVGSISVLWTGTGFGKTTILREVHRKLGGKLLGMRDFVDALRGQHPLSVEESFDKLLTDALAANDTVILDDLHLITHVIAACGMSFYPRNQLVLAPLAVLTTHAAESGKKLIFGTDGDNPGPIKQRCYPFGIDQFEVADYEFLCRAYLPRKYADRLDYAKIHRFAPKLNGHQLKGACEWLKDDGDLDTERFIEYLRSQRLTSNVDLGEVQAVDLHDLKGVDEVIQSLEANIILPLENDELATELGIKPKRGVLLAGPPGTGKTTVGRALAHRLKSKFFLVDGTFISGTRDFYQRVHHVFEAAKQNAPSIIFIDDSDVIFESGQEMGLYRYLLTMLDGLESESVGRVCVMMTAMDVGNLPPALMRSGRIELWLETRLPDITARHAILRDQVAGLPDSMGLIDISLIAEAADGLTGADLKRLVEDGKLLYAYDRARKRPLRPTTEYFLSAVETVRVSKARYAEAESRAREQRPQRPSWFDVFGGMAAAYVADGDE